MPWNSTWPDGTKSVKGNTTTGQQNTTYTKTTLNNDHFWDIGVNEDGHHKFAQMLKVTAGAPPVPADPALATGMDLVYYSKQKTSTESTVQQDVQPFAKNNTAVMQLLGIRACVVFDQDGTFPFPITGIVYSHNVASVTKTSNFNYTVTFTTALPSANYLVLGGAVANTAGAGNQIDVTVDSSNALANVKTTALVKIATSGSLAIKPMQVWVVCFGG